MSESHVPHPSRPPEPAGAPALSSRPLPRRAVLAVSGTAVLTVAAACSSGGSPSVVTSSAVSSATLSSSSASPASSPISAPAPSPVADPESESEEASPTTAAATSEAPAPPAEPAPTGPVLASVADVESAGAIVVAEGPQLLAFVGGTVVAHTAICTHQGCTIAASGRCPCHGSRFDVATGAVLGGPAQRPLAELPVTVSGGQVYAG